MPPRLRAPAASAWVIPFRTRPSVARWTTHNASAPMQQLPRCCSSSKTQPPSADSTTAKADPLPHVSEEAAALSKITGDPGPDLTQGTPVQEIVKGDKAAQEKLPKIMRDELKSTSKPSNVRSYSTSAIRRQDLSPDITSTLPPDAAIVESGTSLMEDPTAAPPADPGHKFGLPSLPLPSNHNLHYRYEPIVEQLTGLLIRHGKKAVAQRNVNYILSHLRTSPPPKISQSTPLLQGHPPPSHLPLNPILYLTLAIDSVAPLLRLRSQKGAAGGGIALQIPIPLSLRKRRRAAMKWILTAASKRKNRGSGKNMLAQRIAEEVVAVVEGRSSVWDQRNNLHKQGVAARANMFSKAKARPHRT